MARHDRITFALLVSIATLALFGAVSFGVQRQERYECQHWQSQADARPGIQFAPWQFEQCDAYKISI